MKTEFKKDMFRSFIKTVSPIHIGCDEVYEPMSFIVEQEAQQIVAFDTFSFISKLDVNDKKKFLEICSKGTISSILEIYKFLQGKKAQGRTIDVCKGFIDHYKNTISISLSDKAKIQQELNRFTIDRTAFNTSDQRPYIPGSSIKGSLRTAYLSSVAQIKKIPKQHGKNASKNLERMLMGLRKEDEDPFSNDPFRLVKVSDFRPVGNISTKIVYAVNKKKSPSAFDPEGPPQILEVIQPGAIFEGEIIVEKPHPNANIKTPVSLNILLKYLKQFYIKEKGNRSVPPLPRKIFNDKNV